MLPNTLALPQAENIEKASRNFSTPSVSYCLRAQGQLPWKQATVHMQHKEGPQFVDVALGGPITEFLMFRNTL